MVLVLLCYFLCIDTLILCSWICFLEGLDLFWCVLAFGNSLLKIYCVEAGDTYLVINHPTCCSNQTGCPLKKCVLR